MASYEDIPAKRRRGTGMPASKRVTPSDRGQDFSGVRDSESRIVQKGGYYSPPKPKARVKRGSKSTAPRVYTTTGQVNQTGNSRANQSFATFTKADRPGMVYHEYMVNGKPKVVGVKTNKNSLGA